MRITIITATYNSVDTIATCVSSVYHQSYHDIEHLIIDGASTDNTIERITSAPNRVSKIISERDTGIYDAVNKGIKLATGDVIAILNSDDFFADEDVIKRVVDQFKRKPALEAVYSDVSYVNANNKGVRYYSSKFFRTWMFRFGFQPAHPTFYVRRELFQKLGLYRTDLKIAGDFELLLRFIYVHKIKYIYVRDMWVKMRVGGVSTSGIKSVIKLNEEIKKACKVNDVYTNWLMVYSKYLIKWWGFYRKQ